MKPESKKDLKKILRDDKDVSLELRFYSGYKGKEKPRSLLIGDREFRIDEIIWQKRGCDQKTGKTFETFKCRMEGDIIELTVHETGEWAVSFVEES